MNIDPETKNQIEKLIQFLDDSAAMYKVESEKDELHDSSRSYYRGAMNGIQYAQTMIVSFTGVTRRVQDNP